MKPDYTNLPDGSSRGGQATLDYIVHKSEPIVQIVKQNPEVSITIFFILFMVIAGLFCWLAFTKFKTRNSDI